MTNTFKVAVLGAGEQAWESRIPSLLALAGDGVEVVGVADLDYALAQHVADDLGVPAAFASLEEMINATRPDGLVVAVPTGAHAWATTYALERDIHVLCEKPMASSAAQGRAMIAAARAAQRVLAIGYQYPIQAAWALREAQTQRFGKIYRIEARWIRTQGIPSRSNFWNNSASGGVGADLAGHLLRVVLGLANDAPSAVYARGWRLFGAAAFGNEFRVEDTAAAAIDFHGGARCELVVAWDSGLHADELGIRVFATGGVMDIPLMAGETDPTSFRAKISWRDGSVTIGDDPTPTEEAFVVQARDWVAACRAGAIDAMDPESALAVQELLDEIKRQVQAQLGNAER